MSGDAAADGQPGGRLPGPVTASVLRSRIRAVLHDWEDEGCERDPGDAVMGVVARFAGQVAAHAVAAERERAGRAGAKLAAIEALCRAHLGLFAPTCPRLAEEILAITGEPAGDGSGEEAGRG